MALIKLGGLAQDVRGTLNGNVFSRNRGGAYIRTKVSPVQPVSSFASAARAMFAALSQSWSTNLTDVERAAWEAFAAVHPFVNVFGDSIILNGISFYQSVNRRLLQMGLEELTTPPATFDVPDIISVTVSMQADDVGNISMPIEIGRALDPDEVIYVFATPPILGARAVQKNMYRLINSTTTGGFITPTDIGLYYADRFADVTVLNGSRVGVYVQAVNTVTGAASAPVHTEIIATAIPGPTVQVSGVAAEDATGGNVNLLYFTSTPHGLDSGQTVTTAGFSDTIFNRTGMLINVLTPTQFQKQTAVVGTPIVFTAENGTVQRTA